MVAIRFGTPTSDVDASRPLHAMRLLIGGVNGGQESLNTALIMLPSKAIVLNCRKAAKLGHCLREIIL